MQFDDKTAFLEGQTINFPELKSDFHSSKFYASSGERLEEGLKFNMWERPKSLSCPNFIDIVKGYLSPKRTILILI